MSEAIPELQPRPLQEVADDANLTYRQLYHWVGLGLVRARWYTRGGDYIGDSPQGPGTHCYLTQSERRVVFIMAGLCRGGFRLDRAAELARLFTDGRLDARLGPGLWLTYDPEREREEAAAHG